MKKLISALLIAATMLVLVACGNAPTNKPVINETGIITETVSAPTQDGSAAANGTESESESENYSNVVYYVGDDIPGQISILIKMKTHMLVCARDISFCWTKDDVSSQNTIRLFP